MRKTALPRLALALAVATALTACPQKQEGASSAAASGAQAPAESGYKLDESKLPPMNSFKAADIDANADLSVSHSVYPPSFLVLIMRVRLEGGLWAAAPLSEDWDISASR